MTVDDAKLLAGLSALIAEIPRADHPYWASVAVRDAVDGNALLASGTAAQVSSMWATMQDWYELREGDASEALQAIRQAAVEWPKVKDDASARDEYFARWTSVVREAFAQPARDAGPEVEIGPLRGQVEAYDRERGIGFVRPDAGGPTYAFRWSDIRIDAFNKTIDVGASVDFHGVESAARERFARDVVPGS